MDNNLPNTQLDDQKMENLRKRTKLSKYIMIAGGVCLGIVVRCTHDSPKRGHSVSELQNPHGRSCYYSYNRRLCVAFYGIEG